MAGGKRLPALVSLDEYYKVLNACIAEQGLWDRGHAAWLAMPKKWTGIKDDEPLKRALSHAKVSHRDDFHKWLRQGERIIKRKKLQIEDFGKRNPYVTFCPWDENGRYWSDKLQKFRVCHNPSQGSVLKEWFGGERFIFVKSGNRGGKTEAMMWMAWTEVLKGPGRTVWVGAETMDKHRETTMKALNRVRCWSETGPKQKEYTLKAGYGLADPMIVVQRPEWPAGTESQIVFKTYSQGIETWGGDSINLAIFDEPPPSWSFISEADTRTVDALGTVIVGATFLKSTTVYGILCKSKLFKMFRMSMRDNPAIPASEIKRIEEQNSPEVAAAIIDGEPVHIGGYCYTNFGKWNKVGEKAVDTKGNAVVPLWDQFRFGELIDYHETKPVAYQLWGIDRWGRQWCLREMWWGGEITEMCQRIWNCRLGGSPEELLPRKEWDIILGGGRMPSKLRQAIPERFIYDAATKDEQHREGESVLEQFERLLMVGATPAKRLEMDGRVRKVNQALIGSYNHIQRKATGGTVGQPRPQIIFLREHVPMTIDQMENVEWESRVTEGSRDRMGAHTGRKQQHDEDFTDLVDYQVCAPWQRFVTPREKHVAAQASRRRREIGGSGGRGGWAVR